MVLWAVSTQSEYLSSVSLVTVPTLIGFPASFVTFINYKLNHSISELYQFLLHD